MRNRRDGTVELLIAGPDAAVEAMIARCGEGPAAARVERIEITESDEAPPAGFAERPTL